MKTKRKDPETLMWLKNWFMLINPKLWLEYFDTTQAIRHRKKDQHWVRSGKKLLQVILSNKLGCVAWINPIAMHCIDFFFLNWVNAIEDSRVRNLFEINTWTASFSYIGDRWLKIFYKSIKCIRKCVNLTKNLHP